MKKIISLIIIIILTPNISSAKNYISKDPNYLKRGNLFGEAAIANFKKNELNKHNYRIILDPTGTSPFKKIESFSPRSGDCGNNKHWGGKSGGVTDCNTDRLRLEVTGSKRLSKKLVKKKT